MAKKKKAAKKPPKTMEELTKNFEEFIQGKECPAKEEFEENLKKVVKKKVKHD